MEFIEESLTHTHFRKTLLKMGVLIYLTGLLIPCLITHSPIRDISLLFEDEKSQLPSFSTLMANLQSSKYEGSCSSFIQKGSSAINGKCYLDFNQVIDRQSKKYEIFFQMNNGSFRNEGSVLMKMILNPQMWEVEKGSSKIIIRPQADQALPDLIYYKTLNKLHTQNENNLEISNIAFSFLLNETPLNNIDLFIDIRIGHSEIKIKVNQYSERTFKLILFGIFASILSVITIFGAKKARDRISAQNQKQYSLLTNLLIFNVDGYIFLFCFYNISLDEKKFMLFLVPSLIYYFSLASYDYQIIEKIHKQIYKLSENIYSIAKFYLMILASVGCIFLFLYFTNFSTLFYFSISLIGMPQIFFNALEGIRPKLDSYYFQHILSRHIFILYLCCCPYNTFDLEPNYIAALLYIGSLLIQFLVLCLQKVSGASCILPSFLKPPSIEFCRISDLRKELQEQFLQKTCSICLNQLSDFPLTNSDFSFNEGEMVKTPCNHIYHSSCLITWMKVKKQCPQCRKALPLIQV